MRNINSLFLFPVLVILGASAESKPLARVNQTDINLEDLNAHIELSKEKGRIFNTHKEALDDLIDTTALVELAKKSELEKNPHLKQQIQQVWIRNYALYNLQPQNRITESEIKEWYSKNPEIRISHIFVGTPMNPTPEDEKIAIEKCDQIRKQIIDEKVTFALAALQHSEAPSRAQGGDLGYRNSLNLEPSIYEAAMKLKNPGDISAPIKGTQGYHLIRLTGKKTWLEVDTKLVAALYGVATQEQMLKKAKKDARTKATIEIAP